MKLANPLKTIRLHRISPRRGVSAFTPVLTPATRKLGPGNDFYWFSGYFSLAKCWQTWKNALNQARKKA